jgi:cation transport regulator ChaC
MKYYFAYGSSVKTDSFSKALSKSGFEKSFKVLGIGRLDGYKLAFTRERRDGTGALDMVISEGDYVLGVVYEVVDEAMVAIDKREGHPNSYVKTGINITLDSEELHVLTYLVVDKKLEEVCPSEDNFKKVLLGMKEKFPKEYINKFYIGHVNEKFHKNFKLI